MDITSKIEGLLLAFGEPIDIGKLAKVLEDSEGAVQDAITSLKERYLEQERGFAILQKEQFVQLVSHPDLAVYIRKFKRIEDETTLSPATLEVLSIISYRAPITRSEIEMIRGVNCSSILRSLSIRGLIEKTEQVGESRSFVYAPSFSLLKMLGIQDLENLPEYAKLSKNGKLHPSETENFSS